MPSLRVSLSEFLHCFLRVLYCTVLVLGEVDKAFIDVINQEEASGENSTFANIVGRFARIGAIKQVEGELKELDSCDQEDVDPDQDETQPGDETHKWIGVIRIPVAEYYNTQGSKSCSVLERVKKAMVLGASAIIIMTLNTRVIKKLDLAQMFSRPIVIINGTNTSKIMDALQSGRLELRGRISYNSSLVEIKLLSTLTLWATCGRPSGWEGVVCLGNPERISREEVNSLFIGTSSFFASVLFCLLLFKTHLSQWLHNYWISKKEEMMRQVTAEAIAKLKIRKYKRAAVRQGRSGWYSCARAREKRDSEVCAVCLDEFLNNQLVRTLPCGHEFHCECVDRWLLAKRTCPLCKGNIIERLSHLSAMDSSDARETLNLGSELTQSREDDERAQQLPTMQQTTTEISREASQWLLCGASSNVSSPNVPSSNVSSSNVSSTNVSSPNVSSSNVSSPNISSSRVRSQEEACTERKVFSHHGVVNSRLLDKKQRR